MKHTCLSTKTFPIIKDKVKSIKLMSCINELCIVPSVASCVFVSIPLENPKDQFPINKKDNVI